MEEETPRHSEVTLVPLATWSGPFAHELPAESTMEMKKGTPQPWETLSTLSIEMGRMQNATHNGYRPVNGGHCVGPDEV